MSRTSGNPCIAHNYSYYAGVGVFVLANQRKTNTKTESGYSGGALYDCGKIRKTILYYIICDVRNANYIEFDKTHITEKINEYGKRVRYPISPGR